MSSSDGLIELELIEALDELSNKVQAERDSIRSEDPASQTKKEMLRMNSVQNVTGLILADVLDENDMELEDPTTQAYKNLLDSLQDLCDALFSTKRFLAYTESLDGVLANLENSQERNDLSKLRLCHSLIDLMKHTVDNHHQHPCTEPHVYSSHPFGSPSIASGTTRLGTRGRYQYSMEAPGVPSRTRHRS